MMQQSIADLFERYERQTNAGLDGKPDLKAIGDLYTDAFLGASPLGIMTGKKDDEFMKVMAAGFAHNREIGTQRMDVLTVRVEPIDALHALAHVDWRATYNVQGTKKTIDFTNVYLTRVENGRARVFGWITGDEDAELRKQGIVG
jgi:hypothetical protein